MSESNRVGVYDLLAIAVNAVAGKNEDQQQYVNDTHRCMLVAAVVVIGFEDVRGRVNIDYLPESPMDPIAQGISQVVSRLLDYRQANGPGQTAFRDMEQPTWRMAVSIVRTPAGRQFARKALHDLSVMTDEADQAPVSNTGSARCAAESAFALCDAMMAGSNGPNPLILAYSGLVDRSYTVACEAQWLVRRLYRQSCETCLDNAGHDAEVPLAVMVILTLLEIKAVRAPLDADEQEAIRKASVPSGRLRRDALSRLAMVSTEDASKRQRWFSLYMELVDGLWDVAASNDLMERMNAARIAWWRHRAYPKEQQGEDDRMEALGDAVEAVVRLTNERLSLKTREQLFEKKEKGFTLA